MKPVKEVSKSGQRKFKTQTGLAKVLLAVPKLTPVKAKPDVDQQKIKLVKKTKKKTVTGVALKEYG